MFTRLALAAAAAAALCAAPAAAQMPTSPPGPIPAFATVTLEPTGAVRDSDLDRLAPTLRTQLGGEPDQVAVMVHGFDVHPELAAKEFGEVAARLRARAADAGVRLGIVGVHWAADPGPQGKWVLKATAHRITSLLGAKKAVRNPYLDRVRVARRSGRHGLRATFFRLQDEFPGVRLHGMAHSMGAELLLASVAPQRRDGDGEIFLPGRLLRLETATLAGSDLDCDVFARRSDPRAALALSRAGVWWVTVPEKNQADGILELRRGAGRGDAMGNKGLCLRWDDLNTLLARRGLVIDQAAIPAGHAFTGYFNEERLTQLTASMAYLDDNTSPAGRGSVLAALDSLLRSGSCESRPGGEHGVASVRLYSAWLAAGDADQFAGVKLADRPRSSQRPMPRRETAGAELPR